MKGSKVKVLLCLLALCILFTSCANGGKKKTNTETDESVVVTQTENEFSFTPESNELSVWLWGSDPEDPLIAAFIQDHPEFTVDNSTSASNGFDPDKTKDLPRLSAAVAANDAPDLFLGYMPPIECYYSNLFISLQDFFENDPEYNFDTVEPNALKEATFNGEVYFLPYAWAAPILIWNKKLFESAGLDPNVPPKTWTEFKEFNEKLVKYDSNGKLISIGFEVDASFPHLADWRIAAFNEHYTDENGIKFEFDSNSHVKILEFMRDLSKPFGGYKNMSGLSFFGGTAAMAYWSADGICLVPVWTDIKFGIAPLPKPDDVEEDYVASTIDNLFGIPKAADNPRGAWLFGTYLMTEGKYQDAMNWYEGNPNYCVLTYITHKPTREKLYDYYKDVLNEESWELIHARDEIMQKATIPAYETVEQSNLNNYIYPEFRKVLYDEIAPQDFCKNVQTYGETLINDFIERKKEEGWIFKDDGTALPPQS